METIPNSASGSSVLRRSPLRITMPHKLWIELAGILFFLHLISPLLLRATFRFSSRCNPVLVDPGAVPPLVRGLAGRCAAPLESLGFSFLGYFDIGSLATNTRSYIAYFVNRPLGVFANVSVVTSPAKTAGYFEFSSSFANGLTLDANTNSTLPLTPSRAGFRVWRFPEVFDPRELFHIHRALVQKYAAQLEPHLPPQGQESGRIKSQVEQYGAEQAKTGYMYLSNDGETYRLTWKGSILTAWKSLWPTSTIRTWTYRAQMKRELRSLRTNSVVAVRTA